MSSKAMLLVAAMIAGCGDDGLSRSDVTQVPEGDAAGTQFSGDYAVETIVLDCRGSCAVPTGSGPFALCDVGFRSSGSIAVTQQDGRLQIDIDRTGVVSRLVGGIDADGSFDVGGYATGGGGTAELFARASGMFEDDTVAGEIEQRTAGEYEGEGFDCTALIETVGERD